MEKTVKKSCLTCANMACECKDVDQVIAASQLGDIRRGLKACDEFVLMEGVNYADNSTRTVRGVVEMMTDGIIELNSELGIDLGFTSDRFDGWLWKKGDYIYISFIESKHRGEGNLSELFENILARGWGIKVPTPMGVMPSILRKKGFKPTSEYHEKAGEDCEVWVKEPGC